MQRFMKIHRLTAASAVTAVLLLAGCSNSDDIDFGSDPQANGGTATSSTATPSVDPSEAELAKVTEAYVAYWTLTDQQSFTPSPDRAAVTAELGTVAVDPLLTSAVDGIVNAALAGQVGYGSNVVHPKTPVFQNTEDTEAVLQDCVDSSQTGWQDATGKKLTVGSAANSTEATLVKGDDEVWRVSEITVDERVGCSA